MEQDRIKTLLDKYRRGDITMEEKAFLESWYLQYRESKQEEYDAEDLLEDSAAVKAGLRRSVFPLYRRRSFLRAAAAVAAIAVLGSGLYFYGNAIFNSGPNHQKAGYLSSVAEISPGGNKATLTLTGGIIHLSSEKEGIIIEDGKLMYNDGTAIGSRSLPDSLHSGYAVLSTPKGGQYQVRLPDGSRVWLNAFSTLKYPVSFDGLKERRVVLRGEAYFEVAKDTGKPFLVSVAKQTVEVLGTRFNINSYASAPAVKTTLLEGSLRVTPADGDTRLSGGDDTRLSGDGGKRGRLLIPGQQSTLMNGSITVNEVDAGEAVAWKNGYFQFNHKNLETALTELARWYDVEIEYMNNEMRKQELAGTISRYARISQVLEKMELTGMMHFRMEGRKIIVE